MDIHLSKIVIDLILQVIHRRILQVYCYL